MICRPFCKFVWLLTLVFISSLQVKAQQVFSEGHIIYDVTIDPPANQEGLQQYSGTYTVTVKGKHIRRELNMDNGFNSVLLLNTEDNSAYSLKKAGDKYYAIELDPEDREKEQKRYRGFTLKEECCSISIAGMNTLKGTVLYTDGSSAEIYYSTDWQPVTGLFDRFPAMQVMPLDFVYKGEDGLRTHFRATAMKSEPVENAAFRIPRNYRILSHKDYEELTR